MPMLLRNQQHSFLLHIIPSTPHTLLVASSPNTTRGSFTFRTSPQSSHTHFRTFVFVHTVLHTRSLVYTSYTNHSSFFSTTPNHQDENHHLLHHLPRDNYNSLHHPQRPPRRRLPRPRAQLRAPSHQALLKRQAQRLPQLRRQQHMVVVPRPEGIQSP